MTTPTPDPLVEGVPSLEEFRRYVGADDDEATSTVLVRDLEEAVAHVDGFCSTPTREIPAAILWKWYLKVGAEIFDASNGPVSVNDRFGNPGAVRSSRDPLHVIMREARHYVGYFG